MPGQRGLQGRFIGWLAVAVLATYALFIGGAWAESFSAPSRIVTLVLAATAIAVWLLVAVRDPFWWPRSALAPAFVAALAALLLSTLLSAYPRLGAEYVTWSVVLAALYLLLQRLMASPFFRPRLMVFTTFAAAAVGIAYVVAVAAHWIEWWDIVGQLAAPPLRPGFESLMLGNPSAVLTASVLLTTPAVAANWGKTRIQTRLSIGLVVLSAIVVILSGSRAGWLAIAVAIGLVGGAWLASPDRRAALATLARRREVGIAALPVIVAGLAVAVAFGPGLLVRAGAGGEALRGGFYLASLRMWESAPFSGTGPGTWAPLRVQHTAAGEQDYYIPHAHNLYFQTVGELGLVGSLAGIVVAFFLARLLLRALRHPDAATRRMGWAALFTTIYFAAHHLLDFYANAPAILFAFAIPIAWLDATLEPTPSRAVGQSRGRPLAWPQRLLAIGGAIAIILSVAFLGWSERGALLMADGTRLLNEQDPAGAVAPLEAAVALDPGMPPYHFALGLALANTGDLGPAEAEFRASAEADDLPEAWLNLAAVRSRLGNATGAREALDRAMRLGEQQAAVALAAGQIELELGETEIATRWFARAMALLPSLAGDPWWQADSARAGAWADALSSVTAAAGVATRFELALELGDEDAVLRAIDGFEDLETRRTYELIRAGWSGQAMAIADLQERARAQPLNTSLVNWCARLLRRAGESATADDFAVWADTVTALSNVDGYEARVVSGDGSFRVAGVTSLFYGTFDYRRPTPSNQLISGLPVIAYQ